MDKQGLLDKVTCNRGDTIKSRLVQIYREAWDYNLLIFSGFVSFSNLKPGGHSGSNSRTT